MNKLKVYPTNNPYYMNAGCAYNNDHHVEFESLESFLNEWGDADIDYNRVHRYDWEKNSKLKIYYLMQRKAYTYSCYVDVEPTKENIEKVRKFLTPHFKNNMRFWELVK